MVETEIRELIKRELPHLIAEDPGIRDFILRTVSEYYTPRDEFNDRFDRILSELQRDREEQRLERERDREEQRLKWEEQNRKWEEQNRKWEENRLEQDAILLEIQTANRRYDSTIGALGARWGLYSESSFRNGLEGILANSFGVQVLNLQEKDPEGEVFGRPDQVEIDVIIQNGVVIVCEIKSSMSKPDMYIFDRKVAFYQKRYQRSVNRKIVISPMVDSRAFPVAKELGIEVYSYADEVQP